MCFTQVERKRHIGNDIVNIIFIDSNNPATEDDKSVQHHNQGQQNTLLPKMFDPVWIKSQFTRKLEKHYNNFLCK